MKNKTAVCFSVSVFLLFAFITLLFSNNNIDAALGPEPIEKKEVSLTAEKCRQVIIDAGHGGEDGGAVSKGGIVEKDINLAIAKKLESLLTLLGYDVIMTRETDDSIGVQDGTLREKKSSDILMREEISKEHPDAIFISIHMNSYPQDLRVRGAQVFYAHSGEDSRLLAESIQASLVNVLDETNHRLAKKGESSVYLLKNLKNVAVLVECGFLSNEAETALLQDEDYQKRTALAICMGLLEYLSQKS